MKLAVSLLFAFAAVINLLPGIGVLSAERLSALYGVPIQDPTLVILMRHRALLLAIVGALLAVAAFQPALQTVAAVAGFASMLSFIALAWSADVPSPAIRRVALVDVVASLALGVALVLRQLARG